MPSMTCKICGSNLSHAFNALVLGTYDARYDYCETCGYLCAHQPLWLAEAYSSAIASTDTGLVARNIAIADKLAIILHFFTEDHGVGRFLDIAGGYGLLTRLMRDYGFDFFWSDAYCQNLMARGFDYTPDIGGCRAVTACEVLEHTEDPVRFVKDALHHAQADVLIFTSELYQGNPPLPDQWGYYSFETGQHIGFFQRRTLQLLAHKMEMNFCSDGWVHIISKKKINETLLKALTGKLSGFAISWIRAQHSPRTIDDHEKLVQQLQRNDS